ncbi:related to alpha-amylase A precursor [Cephalotrichum gorgonifer]|uniref:Alpha-amylase n=1 Tax=Cephalotrichum gorgonifer TaxID=2041049 RepID=A0AAE8MU62_9PEZI|nr:related to alpha-amylase A precursor [Cephalotrichum gorgonifer]
MRCSAILLSALQLASSVLAADTQSWKSRNIYFALTDRVARSSSDTGGSSCGNLGDYCGGTFKGIESKLDYIAGMGFDAIWLTPVVANTPGGYHGYWASDLYSINPNYGTADDFKSLVNAAHAKGIYIMADVVVNHMGQGDISGFRPEPLNQQSAYHSQCDINYSDQNSIEQCWIAGLPDVNTGKSEVKTALNQWISWFVKEYSIDGVRLDTVKHVEKSFWPDFAWASGVYTIGEIWDGNPEYLAPYASLMGGILDYAIYYPMNRFYQQKGSVGDLVAMHDRVSQLFPDPAALGTFMDNHDNARWLNQKNDWTLLKNCLAYVILSRGIPIVYYGTEQAYGGGNDPANREDLWRSGFNTNHEIYQAIKRLSAARKAAGGLAGNDQVHVHTSDSTAYGFSRAGGKLVVLTLNRGSWYTGEYCFNTQKANWTWNDVFSSGRYTSDGSGNVCVQVYQGNPVVLLAA